MANPTSWLDIVVWIVALFGLVLGLLTLREDPGPRRGKLKLWTTYCISAVLIGGSCDSFLTHKLAARTSATGTVSSLQKHGGKNSYSTFELTNEMGDHFFLRIDSASETLQMGETVKVEWMSYNAEAMRIDILSGPNAGQHINDSSPFSSLIYMALGIWFAWAAGKAWRRSPDAYPRNRSDEQPPLNGVDPKSLLNLSGE
jgi:hypothetical protein